MIPEDEYFVRDKVPPFIIGSRNRRSDAVCVNSGEAVLDQREAKLRQTGLEV